MYSSNQIHYLQENTKRYGPKAYNNIEYYELPYWIKNLIKDKVIYVAKTFINIFQVTKLKWKNGFGTCNPLQWNS